MSDDAAQLPDLADHYKAKWLQCDSDLIAAEAALAAARKMLEELSGELAAWVEHFYRETRDSSTSERRRYERDMEPVHRARALLAQEDEA